MFFLSTIVRLRLILVILKTLSVHLSLRNGVILAYLTMII